MELDDENTLHLSTEAREAHEDSGEKDGWKFHRMERSSSSMHRALKLPVNADTSALVATVTDGVLMVTVPKLRGEQASGRRRIAIA